MSKIIGSSSTEDTVEGDPLRQPRHLHILLDPTGNGNAAAKKTIATLLTVFKVAPVDASTLNQALQSGLNDFEDAVTAASASAARCHWIASRDPRGFRSATPPCLAPEQLLPLLE